MMMMTSTITAPLTPSDLRNYLAFASKQTGRCWYSWGYTIYDENYEVYSYNPKSSYLQHIFVLPKTNQIAFFINKSERLRRPDVIIIDGNQACAGHCTHDEAELSHRLFFITHFHDYSFANDYPSIKAKLLEALDSMAHMEQLPAGVSSPISGDLNLSVSDELESFKIVLAGVREQLVESTVQDPFVLSNIGLDI